MSIETLLVWASFVAIVSVVQWVAVYTAIEPWWKSDIGRSLVLFAVFSMVTPVIFLFALLLDLSRLNSQAVAITEIVVLFLYAPTLGRRSVIWVHKSRQRRRSDRSS